MIGFKGWPFSWPKTRATRKKGVAPMGVRLLGMSAPHGDRHLKDARGSFIHKAFKASHEARSQQITNLKGEISSVYICVSLNVDLKIIA